MPIELSTYNSILNNSHFDTIICSLFRKVKIETPQKIEINTRDNDFLELDFYSKNSETLIIINHGLIGSSQRPYVLGMARIFIDNGYDVIAWNYRGCGTKMNDSLKFYNCADYDDLEDVINYCEKSFKYKNIIIIGFSLGGNILLKYIIEKSKTLNPKIAAAIAISAPIDLVGCSLELAKFKNKIYTLKFLRKLKTQLKLKSLKYPKSINLENYNKIKNLIDFDNTYTAPIHGFDSAFDYWEKGSVYKNLDQINIPTLFILSKNDSFLTPNCYPYESSKNSDLLSLNVVNKGGHVGFYSFNKYLYSELKSLTFVKSILHKEDKIK